MDKLIVRPVVILSCYLSFIAVVGNVCINMSCFSHTQRSLKVAQSGKQRLDTLLNDHADAA